MAEGVNVRIGGKLRRLIEEQASPSGLYESASEYVRDLIRRDYQRQPVKNRVRMVLRGYSFFKDDTCQTKQYLESFHYCPCNVPS